MNGRGSGSSLNADILKNKYFEEGVNQEWE
jgi:hypothetical protein